MRLVCVSLLMLGCGTAQAAGKQPKIRPPVVHDGVSEPVETWRRALEAGDLETMIRLNPQTTYAYTPTDNVLHGTDAIVGGYRETFAKYRVHASIQDAHYLQAGNLVISWGRFTLDLHPRAGGDVIQTKGRFTDLATRSANGWQYVVDHASVMPNAP